MDDLSLLTDMKWACMHMYTQVKASSPFIFTAGTNHWSSLIPEETEGVGRHFLGKAESCLRKALINPVLLTLNPTP